MQPIYVLLKWYPERLIAFGVILVISSVCTYCISKKKHSTAWINICLVLYFLILYFVTCFCRLPVDYYRVDIVPFHSFFRFYQTGEVKILADDLMNIFLFLPLGGLLMIKYPWVKRKRIVIFGFMVSFSIEAIQLFFKVGYFETDDLINNTLGGLIGIGLVMLFLKVKYRLSSRSERSTNSEINPD